MNPANPETCIKGVLTADRRILAKTITLMESRKPEDRKIAGEILNRLLPHTGNAVRLGITGVPGAGKSTFIENFGMRLIEEGRRVAVLAVDPSSTRGGGSILADKTRMEKLSAHPSAFVRPSPSSGTLGGVAARTREVMFLCEAAGFDVVIVETVGTGQSETAVAAMVDFFLVIMLAGAGDDIQGLKKGVLELADALVVNKADGENRTRVEKTRSELASVLHLLRPPSPHWSPPVFAVSALTGKGLKDVWASITTHRNILTEKGLLAKKRQHQALDWMWSRVEQEMLERIRSYPAVSKALPGITRSVQKGDLDAVSAAEKLLFFLDNP